MTPESTAPSLVVRDPRDDERAAIVQLTLRCYAEYETMMTPVAWSALQRAVTGALATTEPCDRIVAEHAGRLVGSVMLYHPASDAYEGLARRTVSPEVRMLAVAPEARGLGVGKALMDECVRRARAMGAKEIGLHTSESMRAAKQMYARMGFVRVPERDFRPEGAELVEGFRLAL